MEKEIVVPRLKDFPGETVVQLSKQSQLRYGENPHQKGALYGVDGAGAMARQLQGKPLSYTNLLDASKGLELMLEFPGPERACAIVKHANPCGGALGNSASAAFGRALECDQLSAFGGVAAFNCVVDGEGAEAMSQVFLEVVVAPGFTPDALEVFSRKKNLRVLDAPEIFSEPSKNQVEMRSTLFGLLVQERNSLVADANSIVFPTRRVASPPEIETLLFAMKYAKHCASNAIVIARHGQTIGFGVGQTSRIQSTKLAVQKARENGFPLGGACLASDAFFPFRDSIDEACGAGLKAFMQPGGSVRDAEVIRACDENGAALAVTGIRHFRH